MPQLDRTTHHSASQDVLELKTMLLRLTRLLHQVISWFLTTDFLFRLRMYLI